MFNRFRRDSGSHIPYAPAEELTDEQLDIEIAAMEHSRLAPRKNYLREVRVARHISEIGLTKAEELLGIVEQDTGVTNG